MARPWLSALVGSALAVCAGCGGSSSHSSNALPMGGSAGALSTAGANSGATAGASGTSTSAGAGGSAGSAGLGGLGGGAGSAGSGGVAGSSAGSAGSGGVAGSSAGSAGLGAGGASGELDAGTDAGPNCVPPASDLATQLGESVWFCGWEGNLNHFSWFEFSPGPSGSGTFNALDPTACTPGCTPYACAGPGTFTLTDSALSLTFAGSCAAASWTVSQVCAAVYYPASATGELTVTVGVASSINCFRFPRSWCDAAFTTCMNPYQ